MTLTTFDSVQYLNDEEDIALYLNEAMQKSPDYIAYAFANAERARAKIQHIPAPTAPLNLERLIALMQQFNMLQPAKVMA